MASSRRVPRRSRTSSRSSTPTRGEPSQDSEFSGRSDYGPFIAVGIPAGGLFTGAEVPKTAAEEALYGGVAGASYDPCYHQPCDNLTGEGQDDDLYDQLREDYTLVGNINMHALDVNSDAIATAVLTFAYDTSTVNGEPGRPGQGSGQGPEGAEGGAGRGRPLSRNPTGRVARGPPVGPSVGAGTIRRSRTAPSPNAAKASW